MEKPPPIVSWIYPSSSTSVTDGQTLLLRFRVEDPAPERGSGEVGQWRVSIGPTAGTTWWTASGALSSAPGTDGVVDTIEVHWQVGSSPSGGSDEVALVLSAFAVDGEGQTGADFGDATWAPLALESAGLWWPGTAFGEGFSHALGPNAASISEYPATINATHLIHLDGRSTLVTGSNGLQGWLLTDGVPSNLPLWDQDAPLASGEETLRHLRRVPDAFSSSSWVQSGWADRCSWYNEMGQLQRSWILESDETLLDAEAIGDRMFVLARTNAGEFRLIQWNVDSGSRLQAVTWTPEAPGSQGPNGKGWLTEWNGSGAALESDGTLRIWNPEGGATPITTIEIPGTGEVQYCGKWTDNKYWISRSETHFLSSDGTVEGTWPTPVLSATLDRAAQVVWILTENGTETQWNVLDINGLSTIGEALPASSLTQSGCIAHNRPGPP